MAAERNTIQKQTIYDALVALGHPSATELYEYIHPAHPAISRGTVFRVLGGFADSGRANRLSFSGSDDRFDATLVPHAHAVCRLCGSITDVYLPEETVVPQTDGFLVEECRTELRGVCKNCKKPYGDTVE